jgi:magnesium transporter
VIDVRTHQHGRCQRHDRAEEIRNLVGRDGLLWVDVTDPSEDDLRCLEDQFSLHPLAMEDVRKHHQRPKLERYRDHAFVVAYSAALQEVDFFVGLNWVISVRERDEHGAVWEAEGARARFDQLEATEASPGFLLYLLLDDLVDGYFGAADLTEERVEAVEDRIFAENAVSEEHELQEELFALRRELLHFRRAVVPLREVLAALLRREVRWVDEQAIVHLQDVYDHVLRVIDSIDAQRELTGNAVDAHLAIISNRMNQVMKTMTSWGAILLGSTLVAGIYGMNFEHMPELDWTIGYPFALGLMVVVTGGGVWFFRRKDWL